MYGIRMRPWGVALACAGTIFAAGAAAQTWPAQPIKVIVPTPPGGAYDSAMRPVAQQLSLRLGQTVMVENRPGAGNIIGTQAGAGAAADGYTLTMTGMVNAIAAGMYDNLSFDIVRDFTHIGSIGAAPQWLVTRHDSGIASFAALVTRAKREPGRLDFASSGSGSTGHLLMELLQRDAGIELTHIPYKGGAPALQDVLGGVVPLTVIPPNTAIPHVKAGTLKVLAVSSAQRASSLPDVPTFAELGHPGLTVSAWVGLSAPAGTPPAVVAKVGEALTASLAEPAIRARLEADGMVPQVMTSQEYTDLVRADVRRWGDLTASIQLKAH